MDRHPATIGREARAIMRILLIGSTGQIGWELRRSLAPFGELVCADRDMADLCKPESLQKSVTALRPDVVINAAAYTAVDKAQEDSDLATLVNGIAPGALARAANEIGALLVHYSSDYVFDGSGDAPVTEDVVANPLGVYGQSKLAGEQAIRANGTRHLILRTSWVYGARGQNFPKTMLRLAQERSELRIVNDQIGAPTGAELLADVTAHALRATRARPVLAGTYHVAAAGETSWHGLAQFVIDTARTLRPDLPWRVERMVPIPTTQYPTPARRPLNSRLNTSRLRAAFDLHMPPWEEGVRRVLTELLTPS